MRICNSYVSNLRSMLEKPKASLYFFHFFLFLEIKQENYYIFLFFANDVISLAGYFKLYYNYQQDHVRSHNRPTVFF